VSQVPADGGYESVVLVRRLFTIEGCALESAAAEVCVPFLENLDGPRIEYRWGWDSALSSRPTLVPTQPSVLWAKRSCTRGWRGQYVALITHSYLTPMLKKRYRYTYPPQPHGHHDLFQDKLCLLLFSREFRLDARLSAYICTTYIQTHTHRHTHTHTHTHMKA